MVIYVEDGPMHAVVRRDLVQRFYQELRSSWTVERNGLETQMQKAVVIRDIHDMDYNPLTL
jgi:hypothetical protein